MSSEDTDVVDISTEENCDRKSLEEIMYDNIDLTTSRRKKSQVHFLKCKIIEIKVCFMSNITLLMNHGYVSYF